MIKFTEKIKLLPRKVFGWAIWVLIVILSVSTVKNMSRVAGIRSVVQKEKEKVAKMEKDNAALTAQLAQSQSPEFIDEQIRNKLGLVKTGEVTVILPDAETLRKLAPKMPVEVETLPDPNWRKWIKLFL